MEWTTEPPTQTGLYWADDGDEVFAVDVYDSSSGLVAFELGNDYDVPHSLDKYTHWIAILQPDRPEDDTTTN